MIKLTCNCCGGKLEITDDIERFSCGHCGTEWLVNRGGGIVSLKSVEDNLEKISSSSEKTAEHSKILANEIRLKKIKEKITELEKNLEEEKKKIKEQIAVLEEKKGKIKINPQKDNEEKRKKNLRLALFFILSSIISFFLFCVSGISFIVTIGSAISFVFLLLILFNLFFVPDEIIDEEKKKINLQQNEEIKKEIENLTDDEVKKLEKEINDLKNKAKEIEESFLK